MPSPADFDPRGTADGRPSNSERLIETSKEGPPFLAKYAPEKLGEDGKLLPQRFALPPGSRELPLRDPPQVHRILGFPTATGFVTEATVRPRLARVAEGELAWWRNGGSVIGERHPNGIARITMYVAATGLTLPTLPTPTADGSPWSALFVSYCVSATTRQLSLLVNPLDPSIGHARYTSGAFANNRNLVLARYWAFDPGQRPLQAGDIVVRNRNASAFTFRDVQIRPLAGDTHGDIVVDVSPARARVIGGNLRDHAIGQDTVRAGSYNLARGGLLDPATIAVVGRTQNRVFAVLSLNPLEGDVGLAQGRGPAKHST